MMIRLFQEPFENGGAVSEIRFKMHDIVCILHTRKQDRPRIEKGKLSIPGTQGRGAPSKHRCEDPQRDDWSPRGTSASARESLGQIFKTSKAPRDPVASSRPCLPCTSCTGSLCGCAGRCCPLRTPCIGSSADCARRCLSHTSRLVQHTWSMPHTPSGPEWRCTAST